MDSACLFCRKSLGANEAFETFPVGERLAFDAARGRLWVVCPRCGRWNLSPFEERFEAIEQAERKYRETSRRAATDNIGLAKLRDGTTIIRIGEPLRPEFAAWRYGAAFGHRRRKQIVVGLGGAAVVGGLVMGVAGNGLAIGAFVLAGGSVLNPVLQGRDGAVVTRVPVGGHGIVRVRRRHLRQTTIGRRAGSMLMHLAFDKGTADLEGRAAERMAAALMPRVNRHGGAPADIQRAVDAIEEVGGSEQYLDEATKLAAMQTQRFGLFSLPHVHALAFEMVLHEEAERRAMHGELAELAEAWREAEEIAQIADAMLPASVEEAFRKLKGSREG